MSKKGQGALEYLLLIGGAIIVAVIVIVVLSEQTTNEITNETDFEKDGEWFEYNNNFKNAKIIGVEERFSEDFINKLNNINMENSYQDLSEFDVDLRWRKTSLIDQSILFAQKHAIYEINVENIKNLNNLFNELEFIIEKHDELVGVARDINYQAEKYKALNKILILKNEQLEKEIAICLSKNMEEFYNEE